MIEVILAHRKTNKEKSKRTTKLKFPNREALRDFLMAMSMQNNQVIIEIGKGYMEK